jgi:hypothetical protein
MSTTTGSSAFGDREILEYGPYSGWAFAALALGVLSAAALGGPTLWFIPVLALLVALVAMYKIKTSQRQLSGWHLAVLGLLLAVFFGIAGPTRTISRRYYLDARAARFAARFIELLQQNQTLAAFQLTQAVGLRKPLAAGQTAPSLKDTSATAEYAEFLKLATVKSLLDAGAQAKVEFLSAVLVGGSDSRDDVRVFYHIQLPSEGASKSITVFMDVQRTLSYNNHVEQWHIVAPVLREIGDLSQK